MDCEGVGLRDCQQEGVCYPLCCWSGLTDEECVSDEDGVGFGGAFAARGSFLGVSRAVPKSSDRKEDGRCDSEKGFGGVSEVHGLEFWTNPAAVVENLSVVLSLGGMG